MEIRVKIRATRQELSEVFKFDEVLNIRYYEKIDGENLYKAIIRIPECDIRETNHLVTLKSLKQKVVEACEDEFPIQSMVLFTSGASRTIYASTPYWEAEYAKKYAEYFKTSVMHMERLKGNNMENLLYTPKLPNGFEEETFNVNEWMQIVEENEKRIRELDEKAKAQGTILYRFLYEPVADGIGVYQIIKVNKKSCQIRYCTTNGFNEYLVRQWGETATVPMQYVLNAIGGRTL